MLWLQSEGSERKKRKLGSTLSPSGAPLEQNIADCHSRPMHWKIEWRKDGYGLATHGATGAIFNISRTGWICVSEAAELSDERLTELVAELRTLLDQVAAAGSAGSQRVH